MINRCRNNGLFLRKGKYTLKNQIVRQGLQIVIIIIM